MDQVSGEGFYPPLETWLRPGDGPGVLLTYRQTGGCAICKY
ncbi:MAG TPA: hypothetical protein VGF67_17300 [Ktedonobacteraceae bacterium]